MTFRQYFLILKIDILGECMRKVYMLVLPLFIFMFFTCGCSVLNQSDDVPRTIIFDCTEELFNLRVGTADESNEIAFAPLLTNGTLEECKIEYNESIIDYNPVTGKMVALSEGKTKIRATSGEKTVSVEVVVDRAKYCTYLVDEVCYVELGKPAKFTPNVNQHYNMGFQFDNFNPEILDIDNSGNITPKSTGTAKVKVVAKGSLNKNDITGYDSVYAVVTIHVVEPRTTLELAILDQDMQELDYYIDDYGIKNYTIYSTLDKSLRYTLRLSSDQSLANCYFSDKIMQGDCTNVVTGSNSPRLFETLKNYTTFSNGMIYQSFYAQDAGRDYIEQVILERGLNYFYETGSERICINVYQLATPHSVSAKLYSDADLTKYYSLKNENNEYYLFENESSLIYVDLLINRFCNIAYEYEAKNITVNLNDGGVLEVTNGAEVGSGSLTISMLDGSGVTLIILFYNEVETVTIRTDVDSVNLFYISAGETKTLSGEYLVCNSAGLSVYWQECEFVFLDECDEEITYSNGEIGYRDSSATTFVIEFNKVGKYRFRLRSTQYGYLSQIITVYIFDENSLTNRS